MIHQLLELDPRVGQEDDGPPGAWYGLARADLDAVAGALAAYYLSGRRTGDALLAETQAIWTEFEDARERGGRPGCFGIPGWRRPERAEDNEALEKQITSRYRDAWRRWLERRGPTP